MIHKDNQRAVVSILIPFSRLAGRHVTDSDTRTRPDPSLPLVQVPRPGPSLDNRSSKHALTTGFDNRIWQQACQQS
jgi:hypothetical protein